jgi:hypothetical protein
MEAWNGSTTERVAPPRVCFALQSHERPSHRPSPYPPTHPLAHHRGNRETSASRIVVVVGLVKQLGAQERT